MAKINTVFGFKDEISDGIKKVIGSLNELNSALSRTQGECSNASSESNNLGNNLGNATGGLNNFTTGLLTMNQASEVISNIKSKFNELEMAIDSCVSTYQVQFENELKLETIMKQRMNSTDKEIQSIKDLASAQQKVGIYGDEMILKGAQELASFTSNKKAIETLVPAMNNLIAQQYGYNASIGSFQSVADMMGKVLSGHTGALSRMGYIFSEEEKHLLQTGNEMERASTLAKIITDNVGEMNEALRNNDYGAMQDMANTVGDVKEQLGKALLPLQKMIKLASGEVKILFMEKLTEFLNFVNSNPIVKALMGGVIVGALTAIGVVIVSSVIPGLVGVVAQLGIIQAMSGPIGWIALAIGGIVAGATAISNLLGDVGEGEDELAEKSRIWAENITGIETELETIKGIINESDTQLMFNQEAVDAYRYQLHEVADQIKECLSYSENLEDIDWRNMNVSELESSLRSSGELMDYEIQQIIALKMNYDEYNHLLDYSCAWISNENIMLEEQNRLMEIINATRSRGEQIENNIADAYARTSQGQKEILQNQLAEYKAMRSAGGYAVAKEGMYSGTLTYEMKSLSQEQLNQLDVVIAEMENSMKPKATSTARYSSPRLKTDGSGALIVSDKSIVDIADDYRELLSKRATERFNLQFSHVTPEVHVGGITVNNNTDLDKVLETIVTSVEDAQASSLAS